MKFSKNTGCFYPKDIKYQTIPTDAIEVTTDEYLVAMSRPLNTILDVVNGKLIIIPSTNPAPPTAQQLTLAEIHTLEATITPRRLREALLGTDNGWLASIDAQIATLRAGLI
jgi:hypothetical protein